MKNLKQVRQARFDNEKLMQIFKDWAIAGENEEVGSMACFSFKGKDYTCIKSEEHEYDLQNDICFFPISVLYI
jgi:hypothetical protein